MIGRDYFTRQVETLLQLANSANDPEVAASLIEKAADLKALVEELGAAPHPGSSEREKLNHDEAAEFIDAASGPIDFEM